MKFPCKHCGGQSESLQVCSFCGKQLELRWATHAPTVIIDGREQGSGDTVTRVHAPKATSEARIHNDGAVRLNLTGAGEIGEAGEARVAETFRKTLLLRNVLATVADGDNHRGEDRIVTCGGKRFTFQVTMLPEERAFWRTASQFDSRREPGDIYSIP